MKMTDEIEAQGQLLPGGTLMNLHHDFTPSGDYDDNGEPIMNPPYDPAYEAFCAEQIAIEEGNAVALTACYLCHLDATGRVAAHGEGPLRGILRHSTSGGPDPYDVQHLSCGHVLI